MMRAIEITGKHLFSVITTDLPVPADNEVVIKVSACGVCGTDIHIYNAEAPASLPLIPGHEFGGEVVSCGKKVKRLTFGNRVAVDPNISCGVCEYCRAGRIHLCENLRAIGVTMPGGFAQYVAVPELQAYLLPDSMHAYDAAFVEPVSCCVHGMDIIDIKPGEKVVIAGSGAIGLYMLQLAKLAGASKIGIIESLPDRQAIALQYGADFVISPKDPVLREKIMDSMRGGPGVLIECAGSADALKSLLNIAPKGGRILLFGLASKSDSAEIKLQEFFHKELKLYSSLLNPFTFQRAIDLISTGEISTKHFIIQNVPIDFSEMDKVYTGKQLTGTLKNILVPHQITKQGVTL